MGRIFVGGGRGAVDTGASGAISSVVPNAAWKQPAWFYDPANKTGLAREDNSGADADHPVVTIMGGIVPKWGTTAPSLVQSTTLFQLSPETLGQEDVVLAPTMVQGSVFGLIGTLVPVATFALGVVTPKNTATAQLLTAAGFGAAGLAVGQIVVNNNPLRGNSRAKIRSIVAGVATLSQPLSPLNISQASTFPPPLPSEDDLWAMGDSVTVYQAPLLNLKEFRPQGGDTTLPNFNGGSSWVQYIEVPDVTGMPGNSTFAIPIADDHSYEFVDCTFEPFLVTGQGNGNNGVETMSMVGCSLLGGANVSECTVLGGHAENFGLDLGNFGAVDGDCICKTLNGFFGINFVGQVYIQTSFGCFAGAVMKLDDIDSTFGYTSRIWGPAGGGPTDNGVIQKVVGAAWGAVIQLLGPLTIDGVGTGTSYTPGAPGVFTDGVLITAANLAFNDGLQNPRTGSKFMGTS